MTQVVKEKFSVQYHRDYFGRILHDLGFRCQKRSRWAREQDPQTLAEWRAKVWPRIKKGAKKRS